MSSEPLDAATMARPRRGSWWVLAAVLVAAFAVAAVLRGGGATQFTASGPARPLPADGSLEPASAADFGGIVAGLRGQPVVVNVWASWCGPCRTEAPLLQRAATRYENEVVFLGVDSKDGMRPAREFLDRYGITYPNLFDADGSIRRALGMRGFPTTYIFDRRGELVSTVFGGISEQTLAARLADAGR
jgi:thiol-disulfide isomerase/thioredoxin